MTNPETEIKQRETVDSLFAGGGELGARMRAMDWSRTPLGPAERWPQNLKTCLRIMLTSRQPMFLWWDGALVNLYNDAYIPVMGDKHPRGLGQPAREVWKEIWDQVGPLADGIMGGSEGTYAEGMLLIMERHGYAEETYYTFSYSPVPDDQGGTGGILCACFEDTARIVAARRMALLRELAARTNGARSQAEVCARSAEALKTEPKDLPFALVYLADPDQQTLTLAAAAGIAAGHPAAPERIPLGEESGRHFAEALRTQTPVFVPGSSNRFGPLPAGAWDRPPRDLAAVPIAPSGQTGRAGLLVVGLNPYRLWDEDYRSFLGLIAGQISASIATAQAYEEERRRAEALAELDKAKTTFFSNVSHEFRTPLTLMLGPLEDSLEDDAHPLDAAQLERQQIIRRNGLRLLKLVNTLLDFSRIEAGRLRARYAATDLAAYTSELASVFHSAMDRAGLAFNLSFSPLPEPVFVDRDMWEKIVLNLLSNALKFTFEGGVSVTLRACDGQAILEVRDTGIGIPPEELPLIFTRFHRVDGARSRIHEGSGIGLALVQELVRLHGGTARVESELGRGATFQVCLPLGKQHLPPDHIMAGEPSGRLIPDTSAYEEEVARLLPEPRPETPRRRPIPDSALPEGDAGAEPAQRNSARILLADDNRDMREYLARILREKWEVEGVGNGVEALASALQSPPDLILSDVMMPEMDGFQLLRALRADSRTASLPVILLSARAGEEATVVGLEAGADDYLVKPFSGRELVARVAARLEIDSLRKQKEEQERVHAELLRASESLNRSIIANSPDCIKVLDAEGRLLSMNDNGMELLEIRDIAPFLGLDYAEMWGEPYRKAVRDALATAREGGLGRFQGEFPTLESGMPKWWDVLVTPFLEEGGRAERLLAVSRDITGLRDAEREIHKFHTLVEESADFIGIADLANTPQYVNAAGRRMLGLEGKDIRDLKSTDFYFAEDRAVIGGVAAVVNQVGSWEGEARLRNHQTGKAVPVWMNVFLLRDKLTQQPFALATVTRDITQLRETEAHLRQAQKMEAIGKLAGGIAHDFNNLLTSIIGYAELALEMPEASASLREFLEEIRKSGERAAHLTSQLLAYSRKQVLAPKHINLNVIAADMENMLKRLIGEDIELITRYSPDLGIVLADPGQVQQIILNLALNSRDAMPHGGRLILETANLILDRNYVTAHLESVPGPYVMLSVGDSGTGMSPEVKARIFEPFFTTKPVGKGTGLGLSSVYGVVKQTGGGIDVESEPDVGTTFRIYLPMLKQESPRLPEPGRAAHAPENRKETVFLVEDEVSVRSFISRILKTQGYRVLEAEDGQEALAMAQATREEIHLLLTDMVMPRMGGRKLAERLLETRPRTKVLFMSGYPKPDLIQEGVTEADFEYLQKPFRPDQLFLKLREALDARVKSAT